MSGLMILLLGLVLVSGIIADKVPYSTKLFHEIAHEKRAENVIFSPNSIKSCLGLAFMGAEGETARELYDAFQLNGNTKEEVGEHFAAYFNKFKESDVDLKTANRIYLAQHYTLAPKFSELVSKYFETTTEKVNFAESVSTAKNINSWVESQTNNKIHDLILPDDIDENTSAVLVNAIYFKATWKYEFKPIKVQDKEFYLSKDRIAQVKMMHETLNVRYGALPELNAKAVELPYANTDIHMLIILPDEIDGLSALEEKLKETDFNSFQLRRSKVNLQLPKFRFEFSVSLNDVLANLGLKHLFANADLSGIISTHEPLAISKVQHKAFIEVDERGTEAAAATAAFISRTLAVGRDLSFDFFVNHPFFFAIKDRDTVYFAGHVAKP